MDNTNIEYILLTILCVICLPVGVVAVIIYFIKN